MSSAVHSATCMTRAGTRVEIELGPTGASSAHFPASRFFALAVLHEAATTTCYRSPGIVWPREKRPAIANALSWEEIHELAAIDKPDPGKESVTAQFIRDAAYRTPRNWQPSLWRADSSGAYRDPGVGRSDPRWRTANTRLQALHELPHAQVPHATLRIHVTDECWCSHLEPGMIWDVYAFDYATELFV